MAGYRQWNNFVLRSWVSESVIGLGELCQHNFGHNMWMQHRSIFQHNTVLLAIKHNSTYSLLEVLSIHFIGTFPTSSLRRRLGPGKVSASVLIEGSATSNFGVRDFLISLWFPSKMMSYVVKVGGAGGNVGLISELDFKEICFDFSWFQLDFNWFLHEVYKISFVADPSVLI